MAVFKIKKTRDFVVLDKNFLREPKLSLKAKGLLAYLLSLPNNWNLRVDNLVSNFLEGRHSIYSALNELIKHGYIIHKRYRTKGGHYEGGEYFVYETSQHENTPPDDISAMPIPEEPHPNYQEVVGSKPYSDFQDMDYPHLDFPDVDNQQLINNNKIINININIKTTATKGKTQATEDEGQHVAADVKKDFTLNSTLTVQQKRQVHAVAQEFAKKYSMVSVQKLASQIEQALLDPKCLTQARNDFLKKLNTIRKLLKESRFSPLSHEGDPMVDRAEDPEKINDKITQQEYLSEILHWKKMMRLAQESHNLSQLAVLEKHLYHAEQKLKDHEKRVVKS